MDKKRVQRSSHKNFTSKLTLWISVGGLIGLFLGFFTGILFGGMIYFIPVLTILGAAIGGTTGNALIQQKSLPCRPNEHN